jgi:hypothetical protein
LSGPKVLTEAKQASGLPTMAAEADSIQMLQIWQDVTIDVGDSQLIKTSLLVVAFYWISIFVSLSIFIGVTGNVIKCDLLP